MATETNKDIARRFAHVWNAGTLAPIDELAAPDLVVQYPLLPEPVHGPEGFKAALTAVYAAFPDLRITLGDLIAEGEKVAVSWMVQGTHRGAISGIPASGKQVAWSGITIYRIVEGKVVEERGEEDALGLLHQIGAIPAAEHAGA